MSNERTALIIIGVLALAFVVTIFDRLQRPLNAMAELSTGGQIAAMIAGLACLSLFGGSVFAMRQQNPGEWLKKVAIWTAIIVGVAFLLAAMSGQFSGGATLSP